MIEISENIEVGGFDTKEKFEKWLKEQNKNESNKDILKIFKWSLMQLEKDTENKIYNKANWNRVDKYAKKVIEKEIMNEENVIKFIQEAQSSIYNNNYK